MERNMDQVLLSVAPVAATDTHIDPQRIAEDVLACYEAGAGMVHLHVRDKGGKLTEDLAVFRETLQLIRSQCDIVIEASTGGISDLTIEQRCAPLDLPEVECASLNVGSVNLGQAVYQNPIGEVEYCVDQIVRNGITPEVEVFELGMIHTTVELARKYAIPAPVLLSIVLGHQGAAPATVAALTALRSFVPPEMLWGITHFGRRDNDILAAAIAMGAATVRIGFEDSPYLDREHRADTNAPIVAHIRKLLDAMGKKPMTSSQARKLLGIGPRRP